jgi:DNA ligase 1
MAKREFLQLADHYDPAKHSVAGWFISEKLDGTRCFWDGGLSRGLPTDSIPWASVLDPKTGEKKSKIKAIATGLWSRYGNPIIAPDWFLNQLPCCPLDGELWAGRGNFQLCRSICGGDTPDPRFDKIVYAVYSSPPLASVFATGEITNVNMQCAVDFLAIEHWIRARLEVFGRGSRRQGDFRYLPPGAPFADELRFLASNLENTELSVCYLHQQTKLIDIPEEAAGQIETFLQRVLDKGGEGVVVRNPQATWTPRRHRDILKYKPFQDAEARIVGFTSGRETAKGSRLLGKIGALIVDYGGKRLELSGMTDAEREFADELARQWAVNNPGADSPYWVNGKHFRLGETVTFKYRELTDDGVPKEARYWRGRDAE